MKTAATPLAPAIRHLRRCLGCRYERTGLGEDLPCPECGEAPPPRDWIVVFGQSTEIRAGTPLWVGGLVLLATAVILFTVAYLRRIPVPIIPGAALVFGAGSLLLRGWLASSPRTEGGDIVWILTPTELEVRMPLFRRHWKWDSIERVLYGRGWTRGSAQISVVQPSVGQAPEFSMWVNEREIDSRALQQELRTRIDRARAEAARASELNPPASPPPGPS